MRLKITQEMPYVGRRGRAEARIISPLKIRKVKRMNKTKKSGNAQTDTPNIRKQSHALEITLLVSLDY